MTAKKRVIRCGARLRGERKGRLCTHEAGWGTKHPGEGRCKLHGGATPRGFDNPKTIHGLRSKYLRLEDLVGELSDDEVKRVRQLQASTTSKILSERLALACVMQDRAIAHGDGALPATYGVVIASTARAKVVADRDRGAGVPELPKFIEVFEGKTREDFRREHQERTRRVLEDVSA